MTTDIVVFSVSDKEQSNYRKTSKKIVSILLCKRDKYPYKDKWCLPGGFLDVDNETLEECARRVLKKETNIDHIYIEQLYTYSSLHRDPRTRVVSTTYVSLIDKNRLNLEVNPIASWFDLIDIQEKDNIVELLLDNGQEQIKFSIKKTLRELTTDRYDFSIYSNDKLAFDHPIVILSGLERLRNKINYTDIVFNLMPEYFTLGELQQVYEVIQGKKLLDPAFRRIIANKVEKTEKMKTGEGHRPSDLFRYKKK